MKTSFHTKSASRQTFTQACIASCRKLATQIQLVKESILTEFRGTLGRTRSTLTLGGKRGRSAGLPTGYPHLLFPALAAEKAQAVTRWNKHQRAVQQHDSWLAFSGLNQVGNS